VAIDTVEDMKILFDGIPLDQMSVSMTMNGAVLPVLALYIVAGRGAGRAPRAARGTIQNDILKEFMVRNTYIYPPEPSMRIVADIIAYTPSTCRVQLDLDLRLPHAGGRGDADQELAYTLADGVEYVRAAIAAGLDVDAFAPRLSFFFGIGMNFFMEIAKLRAARLLWAEADEAVRARRTRVADAAHPLPDLGLVACTEQDPYNNVVRTCLEALAAVLGRHAVAAHQRARRGARAAHRLLGPHRPQHPADPAEETGITKVSTRWGGSYYVERADRRPGRGGVGADRGGRGAGRHDQGDRAGHAQAAHRGGGGAHARRASTAART
jgi:methylmalonyl-CoA mutase